MTVNAGELRVRPVVHTARLVEYSQLQRHEDRNQELFALLSSVPPSFSHLPRESLVVAQALKGGVSEGAIRYRVGGGEF